MQLAAQAQEQNLLGNNGNARANEVSLLQNHSAVVWQKTLSFDYILTHAGEEH